MCILYMNYLFLYVNIHPKYFIIKVLKLQYPMGQQEPCYFHLKLTYWPNCLTEHLSRRQGIAPWVGYNFCTHEEKKLM